jgi:EAL domain-containing protein (putative c-di-GMP-specific phosphodiesterase class I)
VLRHALSDCRAWRASGLATGVSVNLSMRDLLDARLPQRVASLASAAHADVRWLSLELTESALMSDPPRAVDVVARLRRLGARVAIDDFGTGYSSLAYLHRLAVDQVKIDRSFVRELPGKNARAVVRAGVDLAHSLGCSAVAEGVEAKRCWESLAALGCDAAQGDYVARPMPLEALLSWSPDLARVAKST